MILFDDDNRFFSISHICHICDLPILPKKLPHPLLEKGHALLARRLAGLEGEVRTDRQREVLRRLRGYFLGHSERLCYRERLWEGRAIGSDQVEGACKSMIGRRLKQTGARWKVRHLNRMTTLCALRYGNAWNHYWKTAK